MGCGNSKSTSVVTLQPSAHTADPDSPQPTSSPLYSSADPVHGMHQQATADAAQQSNSLHQQATADAAQQSNSLHQQATADTAQQSNSLHQQTTADTAQQSNSLHQQTTADTAQQSNSLHQQTTADTAQQSNSLHQQATADIAQQSNSLHQQATADTAQQSNSLHQQATADTAQQSNSLHQQTTADTAQQSNSLHQQATADTAQQSNSLHQQATADTAQQSNSLHQQATADTAQQSNSLHQQATADTAQQSNSLHQQTTADTAQQSNGLHQQATADTAQQSNSLHQQTTADTAQQPSGTTTDHDGHQQISSRPQDGAADHTDRHTHDAGSQEQESRQPAVLNNDAAKDSEQDHVTQDGDHQDGSQGHDLNSRGKGSSQPVVQDQEGASEDGSKPDDPTEDRQHHVDSQTGGREGQSPKGFRPAAQNAEALNEGGLNPGNHTPDEGYHNGSQKPDQDHPAPDGPQSAPHNQHETSEANSTSGDHNQDDSNEDDTKTDKDDDSADQADELQTSQTQDPPQQHEQTDIGAQGDSEDPKRPRDDDVVKQPPPFRPPTKTKDQVVPDPSIFKEVDEYVRNINNKSAGSVESLAQALTSPFQEDLLKIRAFLSWLAFNISDLQQSRHYQLLARPITIEQYSASVNLKSHAQDMGLVCLTHDHTVINVTGDVTIKVKATTRSLESVSVELNERASDAAQGNGSHVVTYMSDDGTCNIYVRPPRAATYLLDIYGRTEGEESSSLHQLLTYVIRCKKPSNDVQPFPYKFGAWGVTLSARSQFGLRQDHDLTKLGDVICKAKNGEVTVPLFLNDSSVVITNLRHALDDHDLEHHTMVVYTKQGISICACLPKPGYYALTLFAKDKSAEGSLPHAGDLLLYSDTAQHE